MHLWTTFLAPNLPRWPGNGFRKRVHSLHGWYWHFCWGHGCRLSRGQISIQGTLSQSILVPICRNDVYCILRSDYSSLDLLPIYVPYWSVNWRALQYYRNCDNNWHWRTSGKEKYPFSFSTHRRICSCFCSSIPNCNFSYPIRSYFLFVLWRVLAFSFLLTPSFP